MGKIFDALKKVQDEKSTGPVVHPVKQQPENSVMADMLVSHFNSSATIAEQFRRLRTHIFRERPEDPPRTILVTSATSFEGKSFVAANLAITIATKFDSYAVLVDCDLRKPSLSQLFGYDGAGGLTDYLQGNYDPSKLLIKTPIDKLYLIGGGEGQEMPVELVGSKKMYDLIADLKSRYDDRYIILDSSPILATTEPHLLSQLADATILVVRSGSTPRDSIQQALKLLDKDKLIGVVLNDVEFKTNAMHSRYFGTKYHYYPYYGKKKDEKTKGH
jgi:exopolysaccharide/PEP-CTERM locus tyrosine autokinase